MRALHVTRKFWLELVALIGAAALASLIAAPALGQGPSTGKPGFSGCSPSQPPGTPGTETTSTGEPKEGAKPPEDLSQRLAQSDGVICPPVGVDPEMKLPTPDTGKTPVIPPPGSPGGDPSVRPK